MPISRDAKSGAQSRELEMDYKFEIYRFWMVIDTKGQMRLSREKV